MSAAHRELPRCEVSGQPQNLAWCGVRKKSLGRYRELRRASKKNGSSPDCRSNRKRSRESFVQETLYIGLERNLGRKLDAARPASTEERIADARISRARSGKNPCCRPVR